MLLLVMNSLAWLIFLWFQYIFANIQILALFPLSDFSGIPSQMSLVFGVHKLHSANSIEFRYAQLKKKPQKNLKVSKQYIQPAFKFSSLEMIQDRLKQHAGLTWS